MRILLKCSLWWIYLGKQQWRMSWGYRFPRLQADLMKCRFPTFGANKRLKADLMKCRFPTFGANKRLKKFVTFLSCVVSVNVFKFGKIIVERRWQHVIFEFKHKFCSYTKLYINKFKHKFWFFLLLLRSCLSKLDSCSWYDSWLHKNYRLLLLFNSCHKSRKVQKDINISKALWLKSTPAPVPIKNIHSWPCSGWKALTPSGVDSCTLTPAHLWWGHSNGHKVNRSISMENAKKIRTFFSSQQHSERSNGFKSGSDPKNVPEPRICSDPDPGSMPISDAEMSIDRIRSRIGAAFWRFLAGSDWIGAGLGFNAGSDRSRIVMSRDCQLKYAMP